MKYIKIYLILFLLFPSICYGISNISISTKNNESSYNVGEFYTYIVRINHDYKEFRITNKFKDGFSFKGISSVKVFEKEKELDIKSSGKILKNKKEIGSVIFKDDTLIITLDGTKLESSIIINYDAKLNFNATIGNKGNKNTVYLECDGKKVDASITTYTYALELLKYASNTNPREYINGSEYAIYDNKECIGDPVGVLNTRNASTLDGNIQDGVGIYSGLKSGKFYLKQTKASDGFRIDREVKEVLVGSKDDYTSISIEETKKSFLPEPKGFGLYLYLSIGAMIMMTSGMVIYKLSNNKYSY